VPSARDRKYQPVVGGIDDSRETRRRSGGPVGIEHSPCRARRERERPHIARPLVGDPTAPGEEETVVVGLVGQGGSDPARCGTWRCLAAPCSAAPERPPP